MYHIFQVMKCSLWTLEATLYLDVVDKLYLSWQKVCVFFKMWIYLSNTLFLIIMIQNVHNCCPNCLQIRFAGSHLFSTLIQTIESTAEPSSSSTRVSSSSASETSNSEFWVYTVLAPSSGPAAFSSSSNAESEVFTEVADLAKYGTQPNFCLKGRWP